MRSLEPRVRHVPGTGVYEWNESTGWTQPSRGKWALPAALRTDCLRAYQAGQYADALEGFLSLQRVLEEKGAAAETSSDSVDSPNPAPATEERARGGADLNFYIGECYYQLGHYEEALEHFQKVYREDYPAPELVDQAMRRVFEIGLAFLQSRVPCEFLGVPYSCPGFGVKILADPKEGLIEEFPLLPFVDDAKMEIARYYFDGKQYPEAVRLYDDVANDAQSEWRGVAEYQAAVSVFLQVRGVDYDEQKINEANSRFQRYVQNHPRGTYADEARTYMRDISEMEGQKNLKIAKFYLRESQPRACEIYLRRVRERYPNSSAAEEARAIQSELEKLERRW